jgi:large subunit ribosomal protein L13
MERKIHTIDATDQILGRLAVRIAHLLRGKNKPNFLPYQDLGDSVIVKNVAKLKVTGKKLEQKMYYSFSGYIGSLKETPLKKMMKEKPDRVLKIAVYGMLPKNKLRAKMMKRLKIE